MTISLLSQSIVTLALLLTTYSESCGSLFVAVGDGFRKGSPRNLALLKSDKLVLFLDICSAYHSSFFKFTNKYK